MNKYADQFDITELDIEQLCKLIKRCTQRIMQLGNLNKKWYSDK